MKPTFISFGSVMWFLIVRKFSMQALPNANISGKNICFNMISLTVTDLMIYDLWKHINIYCQFVSTNIQDLSFLLRFFVFEVRDIRSSPYTCFWTRALNLKSELTCTVVNYSLNRNSKYCQNHQNGVTSCFPKIKIKKSKLCIESSKYRRKKIENLKLDYTAKPFPVMTTGISLCSNSPCNEYRIPAMRTGVSWGLLRAQ